MKQLYYYMFHFQLHGFIDPIENVQHIESFGLLNVAFPFSIGSVPNIAHIETIENNEHITY